MKYKYQIIGGILAAIDLLVYSIIIQIALLIQTIYSSSGNSWFVDIDVYIPTASTVIFIIVLLIAATIGIVLPYQISKQK